MLVWVLTIQATARLAVPLCMFTQFCLWRTKIDQLIVARTAAEDGHAEAKNQMQLSLTGGSD